MIRKLTEKKKDNSKRNQLFLALFLIGIMIFGTVGYSFMSGGENGEEEIETKVYSGMKFTKYNNYWNLEKDGLSLAFSVFPSSNQTINSQVKNYLVYDSEPLYIYSEDYSSTSEIYNNFNQIAQRIQLACYEKDCGENLPIKDCLSNFIIIKESNITNISQQENCVFIEGKSEELLNLTDEFLFKTFKIKE